MCRGVYEGVVWLGVYEGVVCRGVYEVAMWCV